MKKTHFTDEQIAMTLHMAEQTSVKVMVACYGGSLRKACKTFGLCKVTYFYQSRSSDQALLKQRIKDIATARVYYGYRRIHRLLRREGYAVNIKRVYRLYKEQGLQMPTKNPKRRVQAKPREDRFIAN